MKYLIMVALSIAGMGTEEPVNARAGTFSHYGITPTVATIEYQQEMGRIPLDMSPYDGVIAVMDCDLIGQEAWISIEGGRWLDVIVFDCAGDRETVEWMESGNIIGELSYHLADRLGTLGRGARGRLSMEKPSAPQGYARWIQG